MRLNAKVVQYNLDKIDTAIWFGDSWCVGTELEKCMGTDYQSHDQELYRLENRFSYLVSKHFQWKQINLGQEGISPEHIMMKVFEHRESHCDLQNEIYFIFWPSIQRYFWIDEHGDRQDLRWCPENKNWYLTVDNSVYQMYCAQRTMWTCISYLQQHHVPYVMVNIQHRIVKPYFFPLDFSSWLLPPDKHLGDILDFELLEGFPKIDEQHRYFWPAENHPNTYGHKRIAREIINYLREKTNVSIES